MKRSYLLLYLLLLAACLIGLALRYPADSPALRPYPVIVQPPPTTPPMHEFVIFYSGDGGWQLLEQNVTRNLNGRGYGVLGISALAYFWRKQPVADSAALLDNLITTYRKEWNTPDVWLIGFSFGANVLPSLVSQLKPENRARISQLTLLEPTQDVFFEIELENYMSVGWLNRIGQAYRHISQPVTHHDPFPALRQLKGQMPIVCFQNVESLQGLCNQPLLPRWITIAESHGNHYFNGEFDTLTRRLIEQHPTAPAGP